MDWWVKIGKNKLVKIIPRGFGPLGKTPFQNYGWGVNFLPS